jgi:TonB family protein
MKNTSIARHARSRQRWLDLVLVRSRERILIMMAKYLRLSVLMPWAWVAIYAGQPLQGKLFRSVDGHSSIKIISADELELTNAADGPHWVCKYSTDGSSLRIVATVLASSQALYFKIVPEGLHSADHTILYDEAHFDAAVRAATAAAEETQRRTAAALAAAVTPSVAPLAHRPIAIVAPKPEYPYEARNRHIVGSGVVVMTIDPSSGIVTDAVMAQSTGSPILDNSLLSAFRRWKFQSGDYSPTLRIPVTYTLKGAQY